MDLDGVYEAIRSGTLARDEALKALEGAFFGRLEHSTLDHRRAARTGRVARMVGDDRERGVLAGGERAARGAPDLERAHSAAPSPCSASMTRSGVIGDR